MRLFRLFFIIIFAPILISACRDNVSEINVPPSQPKYFQIESKLYNASNELGKGMLNVDFSQNEETDREIVLNYKLSRFDYDRNTVIEEKELFKGTLKKGEKQRFTISIGPLNTGEYLIDLQALSELKSGEKWGVLRVITFEIKNNKIYISYEGNVNEQSNGKREVYKQQDNNDPQPFVLTGSNVGKDVYFDFISLDIWE